MEINDAYASSRRERMLDSGWQYVLPDPNTYDSRILPISLWPFRNLDSEIRESQIRLYIRPNWKDFTCKYHPPFTIYQVEAYASSFSVVSECSQHKSIITGSVKEDSSWNHQQMIVQDSFYKF